MESEIRQDKTTRQWVIYAPSRGKRPHDFRRPSGERQHLQARDPNCPFCPGNESELGKVLLEIPGAGKGSWATRVVANKFPALAPAAGTRRHQRGLHLAMPGHGHHEVLIESPCHDRDLARMSGPEVDAVVETYHRRYVDLMAALENMLVILFRNHGERAGTSLIHPHSQAIVTPIVPLHVRQREEVAQSYFDEWGRCVYCDILRSETADRQRVLVENETFVAFIPYAAEVPFETWIVPKRHQADFGAIRDAEKEDLSNILRSILSGLASRLDDPDYNYVINSSARYRTGEPQLHWYLRVRPRVTTPAGFEIGSGMSINPSYPEEDARFWRKQAEDRPV